MSLIPASKKDLFLVISNSYPDGRLMTEEAYGKWLALSMAFGEPDRSDALTSTFARVAPETAALLVETIDSITTSYD